MTGGMRVAVVVVGILCAFFRVGTAKAEDDDGAMTARVDALLALRRAPEHVQAVADLRLLQLTQVRVHLYQQSVIALRRAGLLRRLPGCDFPP